MRRASVLAAFAVATAIYTYPLSLRPSEVALDLGPDTRLFLWTLAWDIEALTSRPLSLFDANIFHPEPLTLAYSEHQIGSALVAAPVFLATGDLLLSMNVVLLLSCFGAGIAAYYLARTLGLGRGAAITAGLVFALTPPRFFRIGQLHLATVTFVPITLALLHRYASRGTRRHLLLAVVAFSLQAWFGAQSGLFLALASASLLLYLALTGKLRPRSALARDGALGAALVLALNLPFALPYLRVQEELGLERSLAEASRWSPNPQSFIASPTHVDRALLRMGGVDRTVMEGAKAFLFPGFVSLGLALGGVARRPARGAPRGLIVLDVAIVLTVALAIAIQMMGGVRLETPAGRLTASDGSRALVLAFALLTFRFLRYRLREQPSSFVAPGFYGFLALGSLWLSFGPEGGLYAFLHRLLPGFDFIRVPSRFTLITVLALAVLAGLGYERARGRERWGAFAPALILLLLVELAAFPLSVTTYDITISPMDRFIADNAGPHDPVVNFPIPDPREEVESARRHSSYMLQSTAHFRPIVNGYSGFTPPSHERWFRTLSRFPADQDEAISILASLSVRFLTFHRAGYDDASWQRLIEALEAAGDRLALRASFDEGRVYELVPRVASAPERVTRRPDRGS